MSTLALLVYAQDALPPPPEPTGSPEIDTARVIGVVLVSLGVIVLLALAIRPFVVKRADRGTPPDPVEGPAPFEPSTDSPWPTSGSIIPFPNAAAVENASQPLTWEEPDPVVAERLSRVVGETNRRRKLGDRQPERTPHGLATAAMHRVGPGAATLSPYRRPGQGSSVVPFRSTTIGMDATAGEQPAGPNPAPATGGDDPDQPAAPGEQAPILGALLASESMSEAEGAAPSNVESDNLEANHVNIFESNDVPGAGVYLNGHTVTVAPPAIVDDALSTPADAAVPRADAIVAQADVLLEPADSATEGDPVESAGHPDHDRIDTMTLAALHQVVRELLYCANSGQLLHGFALYSDPYLFRFMDSTGLSEEEFRDAFGSVAAKPREEWDHLNLLEDLRRLPDGRIEATATYVDGNGAPSNGIERYRFVQVDSVWQIDDITPLDPAG